MARFRWLGKGVGATEVTGATATPSAPFPEGAGHQSSSSSRLIRAPRGIEPGREVAVIPSEKGQSCLCPTGEMGIVIKASCQVTSEPDSRGGTGARCLSGVLLRAGLSGGPDRIGSGISLCPLLSLSGAWEALGRPTFLSIQTCFLPKVSLRHTSHASPRPNRIQGQPCPTAVARPHLSHPDLIHPLQSPLANVSHSTCQGHGGQSDVKSQGLPSTAVRDPGVGAQPREWAVLEGLRRPPQAFR